MPYARTGYQGYWSLEIFNDRFRAASATGVALDGYRSLQLMHDLAMRRRRPPGATVLPPRAQVRTRARSSSSRPATRKPAALGAMLAALGFRASGAAPAQGRDALDTGRHQPHRQLRARGLRAHLRRSCTVPRCAPSACRWRNVTEAIATRRRPLDSRASPRRSARTKCRSRACAALAAA